MVLSELAHFMNMNMQNLSSVLLLINFKQVYVYLYKYLAQALPHTISC